MADLTEEQEQVFLEKDLLRAVTAYIDCQRGGKTVTPDTTSVVVLGNSMRAILTLALMEKGKL